MPAQLYRACTLGRELTNVLNGLIDQEAIPVTMREQVLRLFDDDINERLKKNWFQGAKTSILEGRIEDGSIESYRNFENVWTFDLRKATFRGRAFATSVTSGKDLGKAVHNVRVVAVDQKQAEAERPVTPPPDPAAAASAANADPDAAAATTADMFDDDDEWETEGSRGATQQPAPILDAAQAQAQRVARAQEQAQARSREQHDAANQSSLAAASGLGLGGAPSAGGDADDEVEDWGALADDPVDEGALDDPLDDRPKGRKRQKAASGTVSTFDTEEELNSDDDSSGDDGIVGGGTVKQEGGGRFVNTVFAQYRKVKRQRNKWACELLAGVATIDGMDHAFSKCDAVLFYS